MKRTLFCLLFVCSFFSFAEPTLPDLCQSWPVQGGDVTLRAEKPSLFILHNVSKNDLWVTHPVKAVGVSAGWTSLLRSNQWSAIVLKPGVFVLTCIESSPGHEQVIPCEGVLTAYQWRKARMPTQSVGTYWAVENVSWPALTTQLGGKGFGLPYKE